MKGGQRICLLITLALWLLSSGCTPGKPAYTNEPDPSETPQDDAVDHSSAIPIPTRQVEPVRFPSCEPDPVAPFQPGRPQGTPLPATGSPAALTQTSDGGSTLRSLAQAAGIFIGAASDPGYLKQPRHARRLADEFNMVTPENSMKWVYIHPEPGKYDFSGGDALVEFARANDMAVYGQVLVWDQQLPKWVEEGDYRRDQWIQILCRHIQTVVGHYRGQVFAWDVVNEPFLDNGLLRDTIWLRKIGPEYIPMAFQWAYEADPQARLVLNETRAEGLNAKSQAVYALAQALLQNGVPLDGIGMQMHVALWGPPTESDLATNMQRLADLGLEVHITEMDVRLQYSQDGPEQESADQATVYRRAMSACLQTPACTVFITWGLSDRESWIPGFTGRPDAPLLFDQQGNPKPAYYALLEVLSAQKP